MTTKYAQGVVDNELRVQGIEGLRVAGMSLSSRTVPGH